MKFALPIGEDMTFERCALKKTGKSVYWDTNVDDIVDPDIFIKFNHVFGKNRLCCRPCVL